MKKGKLIPLTKDLTIQEKFLVDLSKFIKKEKVIVQGEDDKKKQKKDKRERYEVHY